MPGKNNQYKFILRKKMDNNNSDSDASAAVFLHSSIRTPQNFNAFFLSKMQTPPRTKPNAFPYQKTASGRSVSSTNFLETLPDDLLIHIYSYLIDEVKDLASLAATSKTCLNIIKKELPVERDKTYFPFLQLIYEASMSYKRQQILGRYHLQDSFLTTRLTQLNWPKTTLNLHKNPEFFFSEDNMDALCRYEIKYQRLLEASKHRQKTYKSVYPYILSSEIICGLSFLISAGIFIFYIKNIEQPIYAIVLECVASIMFGLACVTMLWNTPSPSELKHRALDRHIRKNPIKEIEANIQSELDALDEAEEFADDDGETFAIHEPTLKKTIA